MNKREAGFYKNGKKLSSFEATCMAGEAVGKAVKDLKDSINEEGVSAAAKGLGSKLALRAQKCKESFDYNKALWKGNKKNEEE